MVRELAADDAEEYWTLRLEALMLSPEAFATSYEEAVKRKNPIEQVKGNFSADGSHTFGAFLDGVMVGMVTLMQERHKKMSHKANIFAMYVTSRSRGKGTGKVLMEAAIQKAKDMKEIEKVNLTVVSSNESAKRLYSSLGFVSYGTETRALQVGSVYYDEDHMELFLK
ncbi:GNAT family N-acetyltransferase [Fictibacillus terranigra]|uniref:GNAT family N-acetyltransferase n=1 Tax=Fictibacillus terranigra TaxID=3058424 RepID=A0ABT8E7X2_9BACL|nr:GNAT family N-acetyltransferase [Fictibacillus sp. CENA-BCM004]MDN4074018.1 GNAT family N-acetyltransferase [Fictibacillus sp. CENA-BCM004]